MADTGALARPRVAVVGRYYNRQGGVSNVMAMIAQHLQDSYDQSIHSHEHLDWELPNAHQVHLPMLERPKFLQIATFARAAKAAVVRGGFDLVHAHDPQMIGADLYTAHSSYARYLRIRRDQANFAVRAASHAYPPHLAGLAMSRRCWSGTKAEIVAVSRSVRHELIEEHHLSDRQVHVIPNGVDVAAFTRPRRYEARKVVEDAVGQPLGDDLVFLFVGYEFERKGLSTLIDAFAKVRERTPDHGSRLLVAGGAPREAYERLAREHAVADRVHFIGHRNDVPVLMRGADVFAFPTRYEASGLVILEAAAAGMAVVTSESAGAAELLHDRVDAVLLKDPQDSTELAEALVRLVGDAHFRQSIADGAIALAPSFDWSAIARSYGELYSELIERKRRQASVPGIGGTAL